jgi:hypothetical protein
MRLSPQTAGLVCDLPEVISSLESSQAATRFRARVLFSNASVVVHTDSEELAGLLREYYGEESTAPLMSETVRVHLTVGAYVVVQFRDRVLVLNPSSEKLVHIGQLDLGRLSILAGSVSKRSKARSSDLDIPDRISSCLSILELVLLDCFQHQLSWIIFVHASCVAVNDAALVFIGPSGSGKSTTAAELRRAGCHLIADDIAGIDLRDRTILGFPHCGKNTDLRRVAAFFHLEGKGRDTCVTRMSADEAVSSTLNMCLSPPGDVLQHYLETCRLCSDIPSFHVTLGRVEDVASDLQVVVRSLCQI